MASKVYAITVVVEPSGPDHWSATAKHSATGASGSTVHPFRKLAVMHAVASCIQIADRFEEQRKAVAP